MPYLDTTRELYAHTDQLDTAGLSSGTERTRSLQTTGDDDLETNSSGLAGEQARRAGAAAIDNK